MPIHNVTHKGRAVAFCFIHFLSFGFPEGFGLPLVESLFLGNIVVGYDGIGGRILNFAAHMTHFFHANIVILMLLFGIRTA